MGRPNTLKSLVDVHCGSWILRAGNVLEKSWKFVSEKGYEPLYSTGPCLKQKEPWFISIQFMSRRLDSEEYIWKT